MHILSTLLENEKYKKQYGSDKRLVYQTTPSDILKSTTEIWIIN